ncbi:DinB family protein [Pedobacter sp.]
MSIQKSLLLELQREKENTVRMLQALPNEQFAWKPHEKSMTAGELANHIVELHNWVSFVFNQDSFDFKTQYVPSALQTKEELIAILEKGFEENKAIIGGLEEENYFSTWTLRAGEHVIVSLPKAGAIRFIVNNHLIHHRGQLSVYLRLLNVPVPGIYGPSADER